MNRILTNAELQEFRLELSPSGNARALLAHQWVYFPLAKRFYHALSGVREKSIELDGLTARIQFNPARMISSAAKVDAKSISERKCFLCETNLPVEQKGLSFGDNYLMLCNPFLIFQQHLTIAHRQHTDQRILGKMGDMLALSKKLTDFVIFYNGPKCGASAPDHFHFQAGNKGFLPLETELQVVLNLATNLVHSSNLDVYQAKPFGAHALIFISDSRDDAIAVFEKAYNFLSKHAPDEAEPMMNLLSWTIDDRFCLVLFPRKLHRPRQFFAEGEENILLSPASVDLAGVFITPLEKDFTKITAVDLTDILSQISIGDEVMTQLCQSFLHD